VVEDVGGEVLLYAKLDAPGLFRVPVGGGREEKVLDQPHCWGHFALTRDGVLYLDRARWNAPVVFFQKLGGGAPEKLASLRSAVPCAESSLAVSQDRRFLLYDGIEEGSDIFQIDGVR
jgi:hypothetical protein